MSEGQTAHVYCETCDQIQPAIHEPLEDVDVTGKFLGGDILCSVCRLIIATMYREKL